MSLMSSMLRRLGYVKLSEFGLRLVDGKLVDSPCEDASVDAEPGDGMLASGTSPEAYVVPTPVRRPPNRRFLDPEALAERAVPTTLLGWPTMSGEGKTRQCNWSEDSVDEPLD